MANAQNCSAYLHGWDFRASFWHGPVPLNRSGRRVRAISRKLQHTPGTFHGNLRCSVPGLPCIEFHTTVYDLSDIGVAVIHVDGESGGPAAVLAVIPAARRKRLRAEFPFEFVTSVAFLGGSMKGGSELALHDYIEDVLRTELSSTQIFTIETAELSPEVSIVLSEHFEHLSAAMLEWLSTKDSVEAESLFEPENGQMCAAGACAAA
jgi:hypothetical protein